MKILSSFVLLLLMLPFATRAVGENNRSAAEPGRAGDLGEHCLCLPEMQRPKRGPDPLGSGDAPDSRAGSTEDQPRALPQALTPEVSELEDVLG